MIRQAFQDLFPEKEFSYVPVIKYTSMFKEYNANIRLFGNTIEVRMSKEWEDVSKDIQLGLIQILLLKLFRKTGIITTKKKTIEMELYGKFLKSLTKYTPINDSDPVLITSFSRVNEEYFSGMLSRPNIVWGSDSFFKLGSYHYATDTVTLSTILKSDENLLDYIMYHELLHKKIQFKEGNLRSRHHTNEFKIMERKYHDPDVEKKLSLFVRKYKRKDIYKRKGFFDWW